MADTATLIERIEAATEGSRDLDGCIALAVNAPQNYFNQFDKDIGGLPFNGFAGVDGPECFDGPIWAGGGRRWEAPRYTQSIDAALTLLPEGCAWKVQANLDGKNNWAVIQRLNRVNEVSSGFDIWVENDKCATPALALCGAIMKAINHE